MMKRVLVVMRKNDLLGSLDVNITLFGLFEMNSPGTGKKIR